MVRRRRRTQRQDGRDETRTAGKGSNGFLGQIGLFESANGMPHGPAAIALAIVVAILVVPVRRYQPLSRVTGSSRWRSTGGIPERP